MLRIQFLLVVVIFLVLGCGDSTTQDSKTVELTVWECFKYEEHELFVQLAEQFCVDYEKKTGTKVHINAKRVPFDDFETNIKLAALGKKTPDIACFDALKVLEFAYHNILVPLDQLDAFDAPTIHEKGMQYMKGAFDTNVVSIKGKENLYGLPFQTTCLALFWNRKMFREKEQELRAAGLNPKEAPKTWDEFVRYAKILTIPEKQQYGFAMDNKLWFTIPFFACYNVSYLKLENNKLTCTLGDKLSTASFQFKIDLYQKHQVEAGAWKSGAIGPDIGFENQKYAMILMGPWNINKYRNGGLDFGISLIPKLSREKAQELGIITAEMDDKEYQEKVLPATNVGGQNIAMFRTCRNKDVAYAFMNYILSAQSQLEWCRKLNQIPVNREAAQILKNDSTTDYDIRVFMDQALYSNAPPRLPRYGFLEQDIMNPEMELALKGQKSAQQALIDAAKKVNEKIIKDITLISE